MKLPNDFPRSVFALAITVAFAAPFGAVEAKDAESLKSATEGTGSSRTSFGPEADYPMILGAPYTIDGVEYVPVDKWNYDEVGYVTPTEEVSGITAAHRTLPVPSYVEVTSLENGKTALVRIEKRGPMSGTALLALSPDALSQIGVEAGAAIRVRRVNPPETERALLRAGLSAPMRLETPQSLLAVLKRKLPETGSASLAQSMAKPTLEDTPKTPPVIAASLPMDAQIEDAVMEAQRPGAPQQKPNSETPTDSHKSAETRSKAQGLVIQAATFASEANAQKAATSLGGFIVPSGKYFRVRTGPFTTRGQADAALAKVKAAGYSDARVTNAG